MAGEKEEGQAKEGIRPQIVTRRKRLHSLSGTTEQCYDLWSRPVGHQTSYGERDLGKYLVPVHNDDVSVHTPP